MGNFTRSWISDDNWSLTGNHEDVGNKNTNVYTFEIGTLDLIKNIKNADNELKNDLP